MIDELNYMLDLFEDGARLINDIKTSLEKDGRYKKVQSKRARDLILKIKKEAPELRNTLVLMDKRLPINN